MDPAHAASQGMENVRRIVGRRRNPWQLGRYAFRVSTVNCAPQSSQRNVSRPR